MSLSLLKPEPVLTPLQKLKEAAGLKEKEITKLKNQDTDPEKIYRKEVSLRMYNRMIWVLERAEGPGA